MVRVVRSGVVAVLINVVLSGVTSAAPSEQLTICVDHLHTQRVAGRQLAEWLPAVRVTLVRRETCLLSGSYRGWFQGWGARVDFVLVNQDGERRVRRIPWLRRSRRALAALDAKGMLAVFSVVLHGLITELELSWLLADPPRLPQPPEAIPAEDRVLAEGTQTRKRRQPGLLAATLRAIRTTPPAPIDRPQPAREQRVSQVQQREETGRIKGRPNQPARPPQGRPVAFVMARSTARRVPTDEPGVTREPGEPRRRVVRRRARKPRRIRVVVEKTSRRVPVTRSSNVTHQTVARRTRRWTLADLTKNLALQAHLAGRWRDSDLWSWEVGGALCWRSLFVRAGYQPAVEWSLEGNPVDVSSIPLAAGWRPVVLRRRTWLMRAETALLVERFSLRRRMDQAADHSHWDVGLSAGVGFDLHIYAGLWAGADLGGFWFPAAQEISIEYGPSARLTRLGLRAALSFSWRGGRWGDQS